MSLHEKFLVARQEFGEMEDGLSQNHPDIAIRMSVTIDGMKIETRSPSGSGDIVHHLYLTAKQAMYLHDYIEKVFYD